MKRFAAILLCLFAVALPAYAEEVIRHFESTIEVIPDGSFHVTEVITYDFGGASRHGIFRTLPLAHPQPGESFLKTRVVDYEVSRITINGAAVPYEETLNGGDLSIKIGDPDKVVTGEQKYEIAYTVRGGLSYYEGGDPELYYNVTGHDWPVQILRTTATVIDNGLLSPQRACYVGLAGETASCDLSVGTTSVAFTAKATVVGAGLTIAQALKGNVVERQILESWQLTFLVIPALVLLALLALVFGYRIKTKHDPDHTEIPMYEPYPQVLPMYTGALVDGQLDSKDITAGLIYLASLGFIAIKHTEKKVLFLFEVSDYEITLKRELAEASSSFDRTILELIFGAGATVGTMISMSDLKADHSKQRQNLAALNKLKAVIADDLVTRGFYEKVLTPYTLTIAGLAAGALVVLGIFVLSSLSFVPGPITFAIITTGIIAVIFLASIYRRRTRRGYEAKDHLAGFKDFLQVTDAERFKFHNAPQKSPEQFMAFLPYAIALGVEKEWAEAFKDITIGTPEWYSGDASGFSAVALATDLGAFSSSFASASGTSPSSGGGSSGGGSGGGGGGSW